MGEFLYHFGMVSNVQSKESEPIEVRANTFGIEVTEPELEARCGLGNLDPQHGSDRQAGVASIDLALSCDLPPPGALLVTVRPDADSFGAMAVLSLRANGAKLEGAVLGRIQAISKADRFKLGHWQDWKRDHQPHTRPAGTEDILDTPFDHQVISAAVTNLEFGITERIEQIANWLMTGAWPSGAAELAKERREALLFAWNA